MISCMDDLDDLNNDLTRDLLCDYRDEQIDERADEQRCGRMDEQRCDHMDDRIDVRTNGLTRDLIHAQSPPEFTVVVDEKGNSKIIAQKFKYFGYPYIDSSSSDEF